MVVVICLGEIKEPWECVSSFVRVRWWPGGRCLWWHFRSLQETFGYSAAGKHSCPLLYSPPSRHSSSLCSKTTILSSLQANKQRDVHEESIESDAQVRSVNNSALQNQGCLCVFLFEGVTVTWLRTGAQACEAPSCLCVLKGVLCNRCHGWLTLSSGSICRQLL